MVRCSLEKNPRATKRTTDHAPARGVLFEQSRPQRRHKLPPAAPHGIRHVAPSGFSPVHEAAHVNAESTHYIAPVSRCRVNRLAEASTMRGRSIIRPLPSGGYVERFRAPRERVSQARVGTGVEPVQPDYGSGALSTELTTFGGRQSPSFDPREEHACANRFNGAPRAAGPGNVRPCLKSPKIDADRNRTCLKLLCRQPPCLRLQRHNEKCLRQESNLVFNLRRVACIHHTPKTTVPGRGIEPLLHRSKRCVRAGTLTRKGIPTWNRTRTQTLGKSRAFHNTFGMEGQRQDSNLHEAVYKTAASPFCHAGN
jgi:hypothetical protein